MCLCVRGFTGIAEYLNLNKSNFRSSHGRSNKRDIKRDKSTVQTKYQSAASSVIVASSKPLPCTSACASQQQNVVGSSLQPECSNNDSSSIANSSSSSNDPAGVDLLEILEEKVSGYNSGDEHLGTKEHNLTSEEWKKRDEKFSNLLSEQGLIIKEMEEDGACLFRAISYQLYGDQEMHDTIRQQTMDYIFQNREYFAQFITEGLQNFTSMVS